MTRRLHIGFAAPSREAVHAFHEVGVAAGYRSNGAPGERPEYYNVEVVNHHRS